MPSEPVAVRERIIQEATRLFVTHGYHGISMREIAKVVGVSKAGLYYHFQDKQELLLAILTDSLEHIERLIQEARQEGTTAREQIGQAMQAIFSLAPERRAIIRLASQEMAHLNPTTRAAFRQRYYDKFVGQIADILRSGMEQGELRVMDVRLATWMLLGMMYPFLYPAHERELGVPETAIELMLTIFFHGAARESAPQSS
ncbi:MAG: TetR family transcriptional regulator [Ardenticatenia bacterium]|nr:TetR family transcriptional regulator [Ardenticatenia bacterium]